VGHNFKCSSEKTRLTRDFSRDSIHFHSILEERLGTGKFQRRMVIALGMCSIADAMEILLLSFLSIVVQSEFNVSPNMGSLLTSSKLAFC
jgi:hypothetical protein